VGPSALVLAGTRKTRQNLSMRNGRPLVGRPTALAFVLGLAFSLAGLRNSACFAHEHAYVLSVLLHAALQNISDSHTCCACCRLLRHLGVSFEGAPTIVCPRQSIPAYSFLLSSSTCVRSNCGQNKTGCLRRTITGDFDPFHPGVIQVSGFSTPV